MTQPFSDPAFDDDLHLLVVIAVLIGQHGLKEPVTPIYEAWGAAYPEDALGNVGRGLALVSEGNFAEGVELVRNAAEKSKTRADQAADVLQSLEQSIAEAAAG